MLQKAYGKSTLSKTRAYECYSAFKSGRDVVKDLPRSDQPSTSSTEINIVKVKEMATENRHLSLREIPAKLSVFHKSICTIFNDCLGMKRVAARLVPKDHHCERISGQKLNEIIEQSPYSPDSWADFFLFPKHKSPLQGTHFQSIEDIKENWHREVKSTSENEFKKCFDDWITRWNKCIIPGGDYFEGDKINLNE